MDEIPDLAIPEMLREKLPSSTHYQTVGHHFFVEGPNGTHLFLIFPFAVPNLPSMSESPGRTAGSRRLRADLARKVAKQVSTAVHSMHRIGVVHGDLTTSNMLFFLLPEVHNWSDDEVYARFGQPETEIVVTDDGTPRPFGTPAKRVAPIHDAKLTDASILQENVILGDFGQSYAIAFPPPDYRPGTTSNYFAPDARFDGRAGLEADVWMLACAIFQIRAGDSLFSSWFPDDEAVLRETIGTLRRLPDRWWEVFKEHDTQFKEDGEPNNAAYKTSIRQQLRLIGVGDDAPSTSDEPMIEPCGARLREEEVELLGDLLEKMLKYRPEERIGMDEVIAHPWFAWRD